ncbi:MAG: SGNH/GDSL hydrolase family protein [Chloroflexi bacterium]|nr:SGNH/GDSL hydrolase family protein [Chloroflexota bacterium]
MDDKLSSKEIPGPGSNGRVWLAVKILLVIVVFLGLAVLYGHLAENFTKAGILFEQDRGYPPPPAEKAAWLVALIYCILWVIADHVFLFYRRLRPWKKLLLNIGALILLILAVESTLDSYMKDVPKPRFQPSAILFWESEETRDIPPEEPGVLRLVALGDSVTAPGENTSISDNSDKVTSWPSAARIALSRRFPGVRVELINLAVPGYSTHQILTVLKKRALPAKPDMILMGFSHNDSRLEYMSDSERTRQIGWLYLLKSVIYRSRAYFLVKKFAEGLLPGYGYDGNMGNSSSIPRALLVLMDYRLENTGSFSPDNKTLPARFILTPGIIKNPSRFRVPPGECKDNLREIIGICREAGIPLVFVFPPGIARFPFRDCYREVAKQEKVKVIDLTGDFPKEDWERLLYPDQVHLTPVGRKEIGDAVARELVKRGLYPPGSRRKH